MDVILYTEKNVLACLTKAEELGEKELIVLYEQAGKQSKETHKKLQEKTKIKLVYGVLAEKIPKKGQETTLMTLAQREHIEHPRAQHLYGGEEGRDKTHHRAGLNHVEAKLLAEKNKTYHFDLRTLIGNPKAGRILGRMKHNKRVLEKYSAKMHVSSFATRPLELRSPKERAHFLKEL